MSKTKDAVIDEQNSKAITIESGKPIEIKADSREDATKQLADLRKQAEEAGLTPQAGGFIEHREGTFSAVITFVKQ